MRRFTKEEIELLSQAEVHFYTVINGGFKRATSSNMDKLVADTYNAAVPEKPVSPNASCGVCSFNLYKKVGEKYYADKDQALKETEPKELTTTISNDYVDDVNNKATNKDKNNGKTRKKSK